jgi:uncharacterized protein
MHGEPFEPADATFASVSPRLALARRITICLPLAVVAAGFVAIAVFGGGPWAWVPAIVVAALAAWAAWTIGRQVPAIGYAERDDELLVRTGILWRRIVVVPYARLQFVDVIAGPLDRALGIASVQLHTASAGSDAAIPGLRPDEAARLRDRLTERGQSNLAGL